MLRRFAVIALVFWFASAPAEAATDADWRLFVGESYGRYRVASDPVDFEDMLFDAAEHNRGQRAAVAAFARRLDVSEQVAQGYADFVVEAVRHREGCEASRATCVFGPGAPFHERVASAGMAEQTGGLLIVAAKNLSMVGNKDFEAAIIRIALSHGAADAIFRTLFEDGREPHYLAALLSMRPISEETALVVSTASTQSDDWSGRLEALIEAAEQDAAQAPLSVRASLAQLALLRKLLLGLTSEAVSSYLAYPDEMRALLPLPPATCAPRQTEMVGEGLFVVNDACWRNREAAFALADNLAGALWSEGRREQATTLVRGWRNSGGPRGFVSERRYRALSEATAPQIADSDLFAFFIEGRRPGDPPIVRDPNDIRERGVAGWLFAFQEAGPAMTEVVAARLRSAGYASMADYLDRRSLYPRTDYANAELAGFAFLLPERVAARQPHWAGLIEAAWARREALRVRNATRTTTASTLAPWWVEKPLPQGVRAWGENDRRRSPPPGLRLPVAREAVLRYELHNNEHFIVYQSSQYDLAGEIPSYGYWYRRTQRGEWQKPLYLALQQNFPYEITPGSALPLIEGEKLRIEARVREIDTETISFPPIAVGLKGSADGLFLEIDLAALSADRDADGLTDIEEARLGFKLDDPDTDDDGVVDGSDPLPLTRYDPAAPESARAAAYAILSILTEHDAGAIMVAPGLKDDASLDDILEAAAGGANAPRPGDAGLRTMFVVTADPSLFAGVRTPFRLIVYTPADLEALNRGGAPFYPPELTQVFSSLDGKNHYVSWTARWVGGAFILRCGARAGRCETNVVSSWIT